MKHCDKHNQDYMDFLPLCPICRGETMSYTRPGTAVPQPKPKLVKRTVEEPIKKKGLLF